VPALGRALLRAAGTLVLLVVISAPGARGAASFRRGAWDIDPPPTAMQGDTWNFTIPFDTPLEVPEFKLDLPGPCRDHCICSVRVPGCATLWGVCWACSKTHAAGVASLSPAPL